ncbi:MAG TPA: porin [Paucimonas sp.]|nr:porin [Paucimonas sp.]
MPIFVALAALAVQSGGAARADELAKPLFSFSGFGTVGMTRSSEVQADFTSTLLKPNGAGHTRRWSADVDSRLGGQITLNATPQLSAVLQVVSEQRDDNSYRPTVEWANVRYRATPDISLRAGRIAMPNFLVADYRKVSYAIPWVRTPIELYGLVPITNSDGVDATYRMHLGDVQNTVQASWGKTDVEAPGGGTVRVRHLGGLTNTTEYGFATLRLTYMRADIDIEMTRPLFDGFRQFGPLGAAIADRYDANGKRADFFAAGASYDPGTWFVMSEYGRIATHSYLGEQRAWYVSGGLRRGAWTPYLTYAAIKGLSPMSDPGLPVAALPPAMAPLAFGLNTGLNSLLRRQATQRNLTAGIRWDFMKNASLKFQYEHLRLDAGSGGFLINLQPGFRPGGSARVFSAVLDFVF